MSSSNSSLTRVHLSCIGMLCLLALVPGRAGAFGTIASQWQNVYEDPAGPCGAASQTMQNVFATTGSRCQTCHVNSTGAEPWNAYGWALRLSGVDFAAVEGVDSDDDSGGNTNLEEICNDAQPGWNADGNNQAFFIDGSTEDAAPPDDITIDDLKLGTYWYGPQITKKDLLGKVVLVEIYGS